MTNELFSQIITLLFTCIAGIISAYLIPWLKTKVTAQQMEEFEKYLVKAVRCANQIYTPEEWAKKKEFVKEYMMNLVNTKLSLTLTEQDIEVMIEGMVNTIKGMTND